MTIDPKTWLYDDAAFTEPVAGMRRRVFNGEGMSMCLWRIKEGAGPTPYDSHPHNEQFGIVLAGQLDFRIGGTERRVLGPGSVYWAPKDMPHGDSSFRGDPRLGGEVWILDVFHPVREEYRHG